MDKNYNPEKERWVYQKWEKYFKPRGKGKPFVITIPPPNVTGDLHLGHVAFLSIIDIYARWHRMMGDRVLIIPGTDHAAIAAQNVVEKKVDREQLGKEKFLEEMWAFINKHKPRIENQIKSLGLSADWSRNHFTLDDDLTLAVKTAFKKLKQDKLIYQGERIINWCARCQTALSNLENIYKEKKGKLYYIDYGLLTVATTRPETMLGDTAVAVHPQDQRYKKLIGQKIKLPIVGREIPIIADSSVDKKFGTGAVKVTPAHDAADFAMAERHGLEKIKVDLPQREEIIKKLPIVKTEDYTHNIGHCERCNTITEPTLSNQWFVKMNKLVKPAIKAVKDKKIEFIPRRMEKIYFNWLENIEDWCISRQLWWGHQLPGSEDTLDTWFSSALWPFSTLGWPKKTKDLKEFYPTTLMVTAQDIIFFWVAKMIIMGLYLTKKIPFQRVYFNQLILDQKGQKMSKSKGNVLDPLTYINKYGADAVRLSVIIGASPAGRQRLGENKIKGNRNFINKLWNIARFVKMQKPEKQNLSLADKWILTKLQYIIKSTTDNLKNYRLSQAAQDLYDFTWHDFADWYIEISKSKKQKANLIYIFNTLLQLLHPFIPFISEQLYEGELIIAKWPQPNKKYIFIKEYEKFEEIKKTKSLKQWLAESS